MILFGSWKTQLGIAKAEEITFISFFLRNIAQNATLTDIAQAIINKLLKKLCY